MGNKKSSTQTTSNYSGTSTTTPDVPDWLKTPGQTNATGLTNLQAQGPSAFTPGISALQQSGFDKAGGLTTSPDLATAGNMVTGANYSFDPGAVKGESLLDGLQGYINPYMHNVVDNTLSDYDENSGKVRAAQAAQAAGSGAFRGSRYGIREADTEGQLARGRATTESGLLSDAFNTAAGLSNQDAGRRQSAAEGNASRSLQAQTAGTADQLQGAGLLSGIGQATGSEDRANLALTNNLGAQQTDLQNTIKQYPLQYQTMMEGLFSGLDPSLFTGGTSTSSGTQTGTSNTTQKQSMASFLGDLLMATASNASSAASKAAAGG